MRLNKLIAGCLAGVLCLTSIPAYAAVDNNGTGGGNNTSDSNRGWIGRYWAFQENNGIRLYLADKQGYAVSNTVDFVNYIPERFSLINEERTQWYKEFEGWTGKREVQKDIVYLGGVKSDKAYVTSKKGVSWAPKKEGETDVMERTPIPQKMYTYTALEDKIDKWVTEKFPENGTNHISPQSGLYTYQAEENGQTYGVLVPHKIQGPVQLEANGLFASNVGTGDTFMKQMMTPLGQRDGKMVYQTQALLGIELPKSNSNGTAFIGDAEPLFEFYDSKLKGELQSYISQGMEYGDAMVKVAEDNSLYIGAEPIGWFVNEVVNPYAVSGLNGNDLNAYWCTPTVVYGTVSLVTYCTQQLLAKELFSQGKTGAEVTNILNQCGQTWQWSLAYTAYRLSRPDNNLGMKTFEEFGLDPSLVGVSNSPYNISLNFWAQHIQDLGYGIMLFGLSPDMAISTSTWDRVTYPKDNYSPGKAPEPPITSEGEEYKQLNKDHKFNIIKFYGEKQIDGSVVYTENHTRENTVHNIRIDDEVDYKVENWFTSSEFKQPSGNDDSYDDYKSTLPNGLEGEGSGSVIIKPDSTDKVLYVKLVKEKPADSSVEGDLKEKVILHENELVYPYSLEDIGLKDLWETFPDKSHNGSGSHPDGTDEDGNTTYRYCSWHRVLNDDSYSINVRNTFDYGSTNFIGSTGIFAGIEGGKVNTSDSEKSASLSGFDTQHLVPNWKFSLYRDKVKDKVTLYPNKNSSQITSDMSLIGVDSTSYIPSNRVAKEGSGNFKDKFSINYVYENSDRTLSWRSTGCGSHGDSGTYNGSPNMSLTDFNNSYSVANNVITKYYLGKENRGDIKPETANAPFSFDGKLYKINCNVFQKNGVIKFYPMIKMTYQTQNGGEQGAYVTSTNESSVLATTRVETGFYRSLNGKPNLNLDSTQWSTHNKTQEFLTRQQIADKNSVLPGGALYSLDADAEGRETWLGIKCWQTVVEDSQLESLIEREGVKVRSQADADWNNFKSTSKNVLEHYQVVQYAAPGIHKNLADFNKAKGKALVSGAGQVSKFGENTLDRSGKYYLKVDGTGADRADIDILTEQEQVIVYKVLSDVNGNIFVLKDGVEIGRISKTQGAAQLLEIPEIKELDDKTKIISNYISGIDRNQGSDRDNQTWYNEAFDGISVVYRQWAVKLGFGNGQEARSSALDTKLTGKLGDRRDLYNFSEASLAEKTRTSLFQLSTRSTDPRANGKADGYIGTLDGLDIRNNMAASMYSKLFYIPNASVTDLN